MSDEVRQVLNRAAGSPRLSWGFEQVWQRSRRRRVRRLAVRAVATAALVAVATFGLVSITSIREGGEHESRIASLGKDGWEAIPAAPIEGRLGNVAVWTGEEMIVWGGYTTGPEVEHAGFADGAAFDPGTERWGMLSDSPLESSESRIAVWTGQEMLVWGGERGDGSHDKPDNGAAYDPKSDTWTELPPSPHWSLASHSAVWTGEEMVVWGGVGAGSRGAAFDPRSGAWRRIALAPIDARVGHSAVWTGTEMIVWGGRGSRPLATGAAYDPASDSWRELPPAPISERELHAAVWTGEEMIVWGGWNEDVAVSDGAAYDPTSNTWRPVSRAPITTAPSDTAAVWTGREMVVVGANGDIAAYSPVENQWARLPEAPGGPVMSPTLIRADDRLILWGGGPVRGPRPSAEGALLRLVD